jgi:hypothetical protein
MSDNIELSFSKGLYVVSKINLLKRAIIFLVDSLPFIVIYGYLSDYLNKIHFANETFILLGFLCFHVVVFSLIEYNLNSTPIKYILKLRTVKEDNSRLDYLRVITKQFFRILAIIGAILYLHLFPLTVLTGHYKLLFDFIDGKMKTLWYDSIIEQKFVIRTNINNYDN